MRAVWLGICFLLLVGFSEAGARVKGLCSNCHTMHNSQGGAPVANGTLFGTGPIPALLNTDCIGCHTGENTGTNTVPYVLSTNEPSYNGTTLNGFGTDGNTLAGGNFYWVAQGNDAMGHNVYGVAPQDGDLGLTPPGGTAMSQQLRCAGTYGCHGDPSVADEIQAMLKAHHADDATIDGNTVGTSYRFLFGVLGYEDSQWEYQPTSSRHNQYKGVDRTDEAQSDSTTISGFCARCHGAFHSGTDISSSSWGSPWLRHPVDYDLGSAGSSEYRNYPGSLVGSTDFPSYVNGTYAPEVPLGSVDVSSPQSTVSYGGGAIITCITCHRAHGTPYPKILRWDYWGWPANGRLNGCNACHSTKD